MHCRSVYIFEIIKLACMYFFNVNSELKNAQNMQSIMHVLKQLHSWELDNIPCLRTMTGRQLYFAAGGHAASNYQVTAQPMKQLFNHQWLSERALRTRMQQLQVDGLFEISAGMDARSRWVIETPKLSQTIQKHTDQLVKFLAKDFYLIRK